MMYVILVYDISIVMGNGQKRLRKCFKLCKQFLNHIQNSVFEGEVTLSQMEELKIKLNQIIDEKYDSIIIFNSKNSKWLTKEMLGKQEEKTDNFI